MDAIARVDRARSIMNSGRSAALVDFALSRICRQVITAGVSKWKKHVENEVISAGAKFFRLFFSQRSCKDFDPIEVLLVCIGIACKVEESHAVNLADITAPLGFGISKNFSELELEILSVLRFELCISQPWPIILYLTSQLSDRGHATHNSHVFEKSCELVSSWQWTDSVLALDYPLLAVTAVGRICREVGIHETLEGILRESCDASIDLQALSEFVDRVLDRHKRPEASEIEDFISEIALNHRDGMGRKKLKVDEIF
jgi:hypothetical protein